MIRLILSLLIAINLFAKVEHTEVSKKILSEKGLVIVDIRTKQEWIETGVISGSKTITFFDNYGRYDINSFLKELNSVTNNGKNKFALICRSGNRTTHISNFLSSQGYNFYNLKGGIGLAMRKGIKLVKYQGK